MWALDKDCMALLALEMFGMNILTAVRTQVALSDDHARPMPVSVGMMGVGFQLKKKSKSGLRRMWSFGL